MSKIVIVMLLLFSGVSVYSQSIILKDQDVVCGAERTELYLSLLRDTHVGLVANKSSMIGSVHLLDVLLAEGISIVSVFSPEHGFRGGGEAGQMIEDHNDPKTGVQVISIYGKKKKPSKDDLSGIDIIVFDIQDVGARFYTYISTLHYVMEAAAESNIKVIILDRPNPNGFYVDGPIREDRYKSFVGMHPVPVVHGMTIGEYGSMVNGEGWLSNGIQCDLSVIPCKNWDHLTRYELPVPPSPNLPNQISIYLYPSLCFFEGTKVSIGRGTKIPFQIIGHPDLDGDFFFRPVSTPGASLHPKCMDELCRGWDLREKGINQLFDKPGLEIEWIIKAYNEMGKPADFFRSFFDTLAGTARLREMIESGISAEVIRLSWVQGLSEFKTIRGKYLLYPDFQ
ncbi:MAG: DUF1343 domain-containing protein [Bacteroidales bacterium]|nr:DUF1343 domain-containing protein [Bacteroidales bacterium]